MATPEQVLADARGCMNEGDLEGAAKIFKQACKRWQKEPEFRIRYAGVLERLGRPSQAYRQYKRAMRISPERLDACAGAAECALACGWARDATRLYGRSIGLGMNIDVATTGIARALCLRKRHHEAWVKASAQFIEGGNKSRVLHGFMTEISPIVGLRVPDLDEFDLAELPGELAPVRRDSGVYSESEDANFSTGSIEAMAGIDEDALRTLSTPGVTELLGDSSVSATPLGIDLSALGEISSSKPPSDRSKDTKRQSEQLESTTETEVATSEEDDDPFADFPELD